MKYLIVFIFLLFITSSLFATNTPPPHLGYGFNVAAPEANDLVGMGFDWMKLFGPTTTRYPVNVLLRIDARADKLGNLAQFEAEMAQLSAEFGDNIEAYEIGNEPNLDASYGWAAPPVAADYVAVLCAAYRGIKVGDADSVVVSAGLAPTGRVQGDWQGHLGHNGLYQDEREFFKEFLDAGGATCSDAIGYHPYGYRADFDAEPDITTGEPDTNCTNGFCFRGVEKIYAIMQDYGVGDLQVWGTEWGWIIEPPADCLNDPRWQGRQWQIISAEKQATNLAGAFQYADAHWPWMGPLFVFNYNFNRAGHYDECEQMRYYGVAGRPAEDALREMPKRYLGDVVTLSAAPDQIIWLTTNATDHVTATLQLTNDSALSTTFDIAHGDLITVFPTSGEIESAETIPITVTTTFDARPAGVYTDSVSITTPDNDAATLTVPVTLVITDQIHQVYLPFLKK